MYAATFDTLPPVGCTVLGAPWSRDRRGNVGADGRRDRFYPRFPRRARLRPPSNASNPAGAARAPFFTGARRYPPSHAGRAWKPAPTRRGEVLGAFRRWLQPLSHGAKRRDSSPFRGAEGWADVCGVYAFVYHDADIYVSNPPVRGGVFDAPRSRDCRGGLVADVRRGRLYPRFPRCGNLVSTSPRIQSRGHSPRTIGAGAEVGWRVQPTSSDIRRKGRRGRRPLRWVHVGRCQHNAAVGRHPGRVRRIRPA